MTPQRIAEASAERAWRVDHTARCLGMSPDHLAPGELMLSITGAEAMSTEVAREGRSGLHDIRISNPRREQVAEFRSQSRIVRTARPEDPA